MRSLCALLLLLAAPAWAQSVYQLSPPVDLGIGLASGAVIATSYGLADALITERCPCNPAELPRYDQGAVGNHNRIVDTASDVEVGSLFVLPVLADAAALGGVRRELIEDTSVFAETLLVNGGLVTIFKYAVQRPLPRTYAGDPTLLHTPGGYRSFYSGHTSTTAAALAATAMTIHYRYGEKVWPWVVLGAVTGLVGVERVMAGRHFPSDVVVGGLMGTAVGVLVPVLHHRNLPSLGVGLLPDGGGVMTLSARF